MRGKLERALAKTRLSGMYSEGVGNVVRNAVVVLDFQFEQWTQGSSGLDWTRNWVVEQRRDGEVNVKYGAIYFGWIKESDFPDVKEVVRIFERRITKWSLFQEAQTGVGQLNELGKTIRMDLRGIIMRRLLPGKCLFCPL